MSDQYSAELRERIERKIETTGEKRESQLSAMQERIREHVKIFILCCFIKLN